MYFLDSIARLEYPRHAPALHPFPVLVKPIKLETKYLFHIIVLRTEEMKKYMHVVEWVESMMVFLYSKRKSIFILVTFAYM